MCKKGIAASKSVRYLSALILILLLGLQAVGCGSLPASSAASVQEEFPSGEELSLIGKESLPDETEEKDKETAESLPEALQDPSEEAVSEEAENESSSETESQVGLLTAPMDPESPEDGLAFVTEDGEYSSKEQVAAYINEFGHLPGNYITKREAEELGWVSSKGNLWDVAPGKSIGGSRFGNYEKLLPEKKGRKYYECDIDFDGTYRGPKRIIYSNDGLVFYTEDHYKTFEQLY